MKLKSLHYLFSKKDKWGSKTISWASSKLGLKLEKYPAHIALLINDKWVLESTYNNNVSVMGYKKWLKINNQTYKLKCSQERHYEEIKDLFKRMKDKKYDWMGIGYFSYRFILFLLFGCKIPDKNKWHSKNKYFCCEVIGELLGISYEMKTPAGVYKELKSITIVRTNG